MLLINPPVVKPCEPPAGPARLAGALETNGIPCKIVDASLEGLLYLLRQPLAAADTWTKRAVKNAGRDLSLLRDWQGYSQPDKYKTAVMNLGRILNAAGKPYNTVIGLANYMDRNLKPQNSRDLLRAAATPEKNPFYPYFKERLPEILHNLKLPFAGISLNYLSQAICGFALAGFIKREAPGIKLIAGGGLITSWMANPGWTNPFNGLFDYMIAGPGEKPLLKILDNYNTSSPAFPGTNDLLHLPSFKDFPLDNYLSPGTVLPYNSSTGCYWNRCTFCPEEAEKNRYSPLPPQKAINDLKALAGRYKPVLIHLCDNALSPGLLQRITNDPPGTPWYGFARIDKHLADLNFCLKLKESGCIMLKLGIESGDTDVLSAINKGIDLGQTAVVLANLKKAGIGTQVYLLFGTPAEDYNKATKTLGFTIRHSTEIGFLNLAIFNMPAYSCMAGSHHTRDFYEGDLSLYTDFNHPSGWNRKKVRRFLDKEFKTHPAIRPIVGRKPLVFTSNHAPLFLMAGAGK